MTPLFKTIICAEPHAKSNRCKRKRLIVQHFACASFCVGYYSDTCTAERLAREFVVRITNIVGAGYFFYVGTTVFKQNTASYCNEALACLLDEKRCPVVFPTDSPRFSEDQVLYDLRFQLMHLTQRSQYMEVRMLETCIHTLMHHMPGRLYLSKLEDVQHQIDSGTISSLFLTFAPKGLRRHALDRNGCHI